jgi:hypothetical protein
MDQWLAAFGVPPALFAPAKAAGAAFQQAGHAVAQTAGGAVTAAGAAGTAPQVTPAQINSAIQTADIALVALRDRLTSEIGLFRDHAQKAIKNMDGVSPDSVGPLILSVVSLVVSVAVPETAELKDAINAVKAVASGVKELQGHENKDAAALLQEASEAIVTCSNRAILANNKAYTAKKLLVEAALKKLRGKEDVERLVQGGKEDHDFLLKRMGVATQPAEISAAVGHLRTGLERELRNWLKQSAAKKVERGLDDNLLFKMESNSAPELRERAARQKAAIMEKAEEQWVKDYDDHVDSVMKDYDVAEAQPDDEKAASS